MDLFLLFIGSFWFKCILANSLFFVGPHKHEPQEDGFVQLAIEEKPMPDKRQASAPKEMERKVDKRMTADNGSTSGTVTTKSASDIKSKMKKMGWDVSKQIGWAELKPEFGVMYVQKNIHGRFCKLGAEGPECESGSDSQEDGAATESSLEQYKGSGYQTDCHTDELNQQRMNVKAPIVPGTTKKIVENQNTYLSKAFISRAVRRFNVTAEQEPKNGFALFDIMMAIVHNICPEQTLPSTFLHSLIFFMKELHAYVSPKRTPYLSDDEFTWISSILNKCHNRTQRDFKASNDKICRSELTPLQPNGAYLCNGPPLNVDFHFHEKVYDPALDVIWHIFTSISYLCFQDFSKDSSRMYHHFAAAIMDLFTPPMKVKWTNQIQDDYKKGFQRLLGPFYQLYMENMERCVLYIKEKIRIPNIAIPRFYSHGTLRIG